MRRAQRPRDGAALSALASTSLSPKILRNNILGSKVRVNLAEIVRVWWGQEEMISNFSREALKKENQRFMRPADTLVHWFHWLQCPYMQMLNLLTGQGSAKCIDLIDFMVRGANCDCDCDGKTYYD